MIVLLPVFTFLLFLAALDPFRGFLFMLVTGFLQDPLRKLSPSESVYWLALVGLVFATSLLGMLSRGAGGRFLHSPWGRSLRVPARVFLAVVLLGAILSFFRTHQVPLVVIGVASYLGPAGAVVLGYTYAKKPAQSLRMLRLYCVLAGVMASGVYMSQFGVGWRVLDSVGEGLVVYSEKGPIVLPAGFFRSSEVASWHCATAACLTVVLGVMKLRSWWGSFKSIAILLYFTGAVVLAGRRKGLGEIIVFGALYGVVLLVTRRSLGRLGRLLIALGIVASLAFQYQLFFDEGEAQISSMQHRSSTSGSFDRLAAGISTIPEIVRRDGFFGLGAGLLTQGGQHFGADLDLGVVSEGGVARVVGELGVPGLVASLWVLWRILQPLARRIRRVRVLSANDSYYLLGLLAVLGANGVVFITAHQVFGDPFIYILLGAFIGFLLSASEAVDRAVAEKRRVETPPPEAQALSLAAAGA